MNLQRFTSILALLFFAGCNDAQVTINSLKSAKATSSSPSAGSSYQASGGNPINAESTGAGIGTTTGLGPNNIVNIKVTTLSLSPINSAAKTTGSGTNYYITAKAVIP